MARADELAGRTALVTGAGHGLGRATAIMLAAAGARVILTGRTTDALRETADLIKSHRPVRDPGWARVAPGDVSSPESVGALRDSLAGEEVAILVNNAGIGGPVKALTDIEPAEWDEVFGVLGLTRTLAFEAGPQGVRVNSLSPGPCHGARMTRNFTREAAATGTSYAQAEGAFVSRAALHRLVEEDEVLAMLRMPGRCGADIDLSAGMIAPA